jgi:MFS family permease
MAVQLTITSYLVVAGIAPAFMGDMADRGGRRPVYVLMFALMVGANVGIAVNKKYAGLVVLRMVQSAGSSGEFDFLLKSLGLVCECIVEIGLPGGDKEGGWSKAGNGGCCGMI